MITNVDHAISVFDLRSAFGNMFTEAVGKPFAFLYYLAKVLTLVYFALLAYEFHS